MIFSLAAPSAARTASQLGHRPSPSPSPPAPSTSATSSVSSFASSSRKMTSKLVHAPSHRNLGRREGLPARTAATTRMPLSAAATETTPSAATGRRQQPLAQAHESSSSSCSSSSSASSVVVGASEVTCSSSPSEGSSAAARSSPHHETPTHRVRIEPASAAVVRRGPTVLSLPDEALSEALVFHREIGFGNWGSVWLCTARKTAGGEPPRKVAVKLVHRQKGANSTNFTTTARIQALWNEVKVLHSLPVPIDADGKNGLADDGWGVGQPTASRIAAHPSIIVFEQFVLSPSYALVTMAFCERPMPVGITEIEARPYFRGLIDGVRFLHANNVSHNDIKPANVLLSSTDQAVLVDFGFATSWKPSKSASSSASSSCSNRPSRRQQRQMEDAQPKPFWSNVSWGTPEYLSASRAAGNWHDERTSDVWSLGVTCFEVLTGRTPFELDPTESFATAAELEVYHARTVDGRWLGQWPELSNEMEELLRGMTDPVDDRRLTAEQAVWHRALKDEPGDIRRQSVLDRAQPPVVAPAISAERSINKPVITATTRTDDPSSSANTSDDGHWTLREKKTASPPKKVVRVTAAAAAAAGTRSAKAENDGAASLLRFDKKGGRQPSAGSRLETSPSKERLRLTKAVRIKVPTSPRKVSGSSPRRSRIAANAPSTSISKIAYHRPTPANHTGSAIPATHLSAVVSTHARLTDAAPSAAAPRDARVRKRLERILIDSSACRAPSPTVSGGSKSQSVSYRYADAVDEADKENASVVRASAALDDSVSPLQPPQPQPAQSTRSRLVRRVPVPNVKDRPLSRVSATFGESPALRPSASARTLRNRVSEASLPSIEIAQSSGDAGIDTKLDRISLWARSVDRMVEETRHSIHARNSLIGASPSAGNRGHKSSQSESFLTTPSKNELAGIRPSHVLSPSHKVTPSRTTLNGQAVFLPNGRGLADVPESISGSPAVVRSLSTPARDDGRDVREAPVLLSQRIYETIHFAPRQMQLEEAATEQEPPRSTRLKRSRSKLLALFQATHDPRTDPALTTIPTERLSFLKFPPPASVVAPLQSNQAPIKRRSSLLRLKSIKNIRSALTKDRETARSPAPPVPSQIPVAMSTHGRQPSVLGRPSTTLSRRIPSPQPPTPSTLSTSALLTPRSAFSPEPVEIVPLDQAESRPSGTLTSIQGFGDKSLGHSRTSGANGTQASRKSHRSTPSLSEGLRSLFSPTPPPFDKSALDRERIRSGTPNTMLSAWTDTTADDASAPVGKAGRFATALKGLSFSRRHKKTPSSAVINPALEYDY